MTEYGKRRRRGSRRFGGARDGFATSMVAGIALARRVFPSRSRVGRSARGMSRALACSGMQETALVNLPAAAIAAVVSVRNLASGSAATARVGPGLRHKAYARIVASGIAVDGPSGVRVRVAEPAKTRCVLRACPENPPSGRGKPGLLPLWTASCAGRYGAPFSDRCPHGSVTRISRDSAFRRFPATQGRPQHVGFSRRLLGGDSRGRPASGITATAVAVVSDGLRPG